MNTFTSYLMGKYSLPNVGLGVYVGLCDHLIPSSDRKLLVDKLHQKHEILMG